MSAPQPGTPLVELQAIAQQIADTSSWAKGTDNYARIYQGALAGAMWCDEANHIKTQALADALRAMHTLAVKEYAYLAHKGTKEGEVLAKAERALAAWDAKP